MIFIFFFFFVLLCAKYQNEYDAAKQLKTVNKFIIRLFYGPGSIAYTTKIHLGPEEMAWIHCPFELLNVAPELNPKNHSISEFGMSSVLYYTILLRKYVCWLSLTQAIVLYPIPYTRRIIMSLYTKNIPPFASTINLNGHLKLIFEATSMRLIFIYFHEMEILSSITLNHQWK